MGASCQKDQVLIRALGPSAFPPQILGKREWPEIEFRHHWPIINQTCLDNETSIKTPTRRGSESFHVGEHIQGDTPDWALHGYTMSPSRHRP